MNHLRRGDPFNASGVCTLVEMSDALVCGLGCQTTILTLQRETVFHGAHLDVGLGRLL